MRFYISQKIVYSHLHPVGGKRLAARETKRLEAWLQLQFENNRRVTDLTLTYDLKPYGGERNPHAGRHVWDDMKQAKHVPRFFERLAEHTGVDFRGRWRAKLEFTELGVPHWHIVVEGMPFVAKRELDQIWGHGFTWVRKAKRATIAYLAKYNAKDCSYPEWLYDQPRRSVKIWSTSPGFWKELEASLPEPDADPASGSFDEFLIAARKDLSDRRQSFVHQMGIERPEWESLSIREINERTSDTTIIKDENGETVEVAGIDVSTLNVVLSQLNADYEGSKYGWMRWDSHWNEIELAVKTAVTARHLIDTNAEFNAGLDYWSRQGDDGDLAGPPAKRGPGETPLTLYKYQVRENIDDDDLPFSDDDPQYGEIIYHDEIPF